MMADCDAGKRRRRDQLSLNWATKATTISATTEPETHGLTEMLQAVWQPAVTL